MSTMETETLSPAELDAELAAVVDDVFRYFPLVVRNKAATALIEAAYLRGIQEGMNKAQRVYCESTIKGETV